MAKNRKLYIICAVLAVLVLVFALSSVYARYVYSNDGESTLYAKDFYFTSDILKTGGAVYTLSTDETGKTSVSFNVRNYVDELRINDHDITYTVTVDPAATLSSEGGTLTGDGINQVDDEIIVENLQAGESYTVKVTSQQTDGKGFVKTLSATFKVIQPDMTAFMHLDVSNPAYVVLTVWTKNLAGDAQISFPAGLVPDETDAVIHAANINNCEGGVYKAGTFMDTTSFDAAYSSHAYRFFIDEVKKTYMVSDFDVMVGPVSAQAKNIIE